MAATSTQRNPKKKALPPKAKPKRLSKSRKALLQKAQDAGGMSDVAVSHTSKAKILKKLREEH